MSVIGNPAFSGADRNYVFASTSATKEVFSVVFEVLGKISESATSVLGRAAGTKKKVVESIVCSIGSRKGLRFGCLPRYGKG